MQSAGLAGIPPRGWAHTAPALSALRRAGRNTKEGTDNPHPRQHPKAEPRATRPPEQHLCSASAFPKGPPERHQSVSNTNVTASGCVGWRHLTRAEALSPYITSLLQSLPAFTKPSCDTFILPKASRRARHNPQLSPRHTLHFLQALSPWKKSKGGPGGAERQRGRCSWAVTVCGAHNGSGKKLRAELVHQQAHGNPCLPSCSISRRTACCFVSLHSGGVADRQ